MMNILENAIRDHLELARERGMGTREARQKENAAFGKPMSAEEADIHAAMGGSGSESVTPSQAAQANATVELGVDEHHSGELSTVNCETEEYSVEDLGLADVDSGDPVAVSSQSRTEPFDWPNA